MSENLKKVLHNKGLEITFFVQDGIARVEYRAGDEFDLSSPEDIVLFVNSDHIAVQPTGVGQATGVIGEWSAYSGDLVRLTTRVGEFFEGWEFEP